MASMDLATAQAMTELYTTTRLVLIDETYHINDTKSIWFSLDQINAFMATLTPETTGVRFYLGVYDNDNLLYPGQTTIIAIGTVADTLGNNVDSLTCGLGYGGGDGNDPYNHGELCPPSTGCG